MISPQLIIIVIIIIVVQYIKTIIVVIEHCYSKSVGFVLFFIREVEKIQNFFSIITLKTTTTLINYYYTTKAFYIFAFFSM